MIIKSIGAIKCINCTDRERGVIPCVIIHVRAAVAAGLEKTDFYQLKCIVDQ